MNLEEKIKLDQEVIDAFPLNNQEDKDKFIKEANIIYAKYNTLRLSYEEEIKERIIAIEDKFKGEKVELNNYEELDYAFKIVNPFNSSYEKLGFDELFFKIDHINSLNLKQFNEIVKNILKLFKEAGIILNADQFFYDEYTHSYLKEILNSNDFDTLNSNFEDYYWKNPHLIRNIKLNFISLYLFYKEDFEKYVLSLREKIGKSFKDIIKEYHRNLVEDNNNLLKDKEGIINKFLNKELNIKNFEESKIEKIGNSLINGNYLEFMRVIFNLNDTLKEYDSYLEFEPLIQVLKKEREEIKGDDLIKRKFFKKTYKTSLIVKEIRRKEKTLEKNSGDDNIIGEIEKLFIDYQELYYKEALFKNISSNSRIIDSLLFFYSYYGYFLKIKDDDTKIHIDSIKSFILNPYLNLINNLFLFKDYDIEKIIKQKYILDNIKMNDFVLDKEGIKLLLRDIQMLFYFYVLKEEQIDIGLINDYLMLKEVKIDK